MKKLQLEVEPDLDFVLIGLVTNQKITRLAYLLNQNADLNLHRQDDLKLADFNPGNTTCFSKLDFYDEENHLSYSLIANRDSGEFLLPSLKQFDYFLVIRGGLEFFNANEFSPKLRNLAEIRLISEIENNKLKNKISWIV